MDTKYRSSRDIVLPNYVILGFCFVITAMVSGCFGTYGKLHWDPQVTTSFKAYEAQRDFNYYSYGVGNRTFAIAGISPDYVMESKMWREVQPDTEEFKGLISRAWENSYYHPYDPQGAYILNPEGKQVGIWYSSLRFVTVKFGENVESNPYISYQPKVFSGGRR